MTKLSAATATNPTNLPPRYEIRRLTEEHIEWVKAIVLHSNMFYSPVWPVCYPEAKTARLYRGFGAVDYLIRHQIESGHSFGVFDLEYKFKRDESKSTGGKLYWDLKDETLDQDQLLQQMDFPLVSVALAYDGLHELDMEKIMPLIECLPLFGAVYHVLEESDPREAASWKPTGEKQVLMRNATSTRHDAEGNGIMKALAQFLMRYAAEQGFRGIQIECLADAVTKVWSQPPAPFKSTIVAEFNTQDYEEEVEVDGVKKKVKPFGEAKQRATKVYCELKPTQNGHANGLAPAAVPAVGALG
ncbi:uncharacterized protein Z520_01634 [Fonsecaea multimorphosa CBS 102226]|uniref:N-acetyltransferase domain-containing protein n=1 Tax=Fonsecaea multimorphosa CBS 102226 TaxID=1442371 RepID=A0A0D2J1A5_9EURO|nr:uncharacterized protein Z520_01634 [Fonsecaea multimorphosa CBS 102226]KIY03167.1 hypothetical protein Z520_01634 [Fonsecaea multimorphosa CBS 102226]OAL30410.1 hypothetical protein AYO22_01608 [Fonsecaea multimorphosa]